MQQGVYILVFCFLVSISFAATKENQKKVRVTIHDETSRTEVITKNDGRELERVRYEKSGEQWVAKEKSIFRLDHYGKITSGHLLDITTDKVIGRIRCDYDAYNRVKEERVYDLRGALIRKDVFSYDKLGTQKKPLTYVYVNGVEKLITPIPENHTVENSSSQKTKSSKKRRRLFRKK